MVRGMPGLLLVVALGVPLPLGLLADGEWWEELLGANVVASAGLWPASLSRLERPGAPRKASQARDHRPVSGRRPGKGEGSAEAGRASQATRAQPAGRVVRWRTPVPVRICR